MKIGIINGSHRAAQSLKVAKFSSRILTENLGKRPSGETVETTLIDLAGNPLPLWDQDLWTDNDPRWQKAWAPLARELAACDGFVVVSPEWGGMVPPGLKNLLLIAGAEFAHKPAAIVAVSAGTGGAYPVAELRMSGYKNNHICFIPEHVIIRDVANVMNDHEAAVQSPDAYMRQRLEYTLAVLLEYAGALRQVRESGVLKLKEYPYGM